MKDRVIPVFIVAYSCEAPSEESLKEVLPEFKAPANYKDEEKIRVYCEEAKRKWIAATATHPYLGKVKELLVADVTRGKHLAYSDADTPAKGPIHSRLAQYLTRFCSDCLQGGVADAGRLSCIVIGFEPSLVVKMLGIQGTMPAADGEYAPLPLLFWYGNTGCRDLVEACKLDGLDWKTVLRLRGLACPEGWNGPGSDAATDLKLAFELASQLGFVAVKPAKE